ncbi:MAG: carbohydrate ABC transporter permease [Limnochordia bacterium]|jgi:multiple sugar transport system permease protein
MTQTQLRRLNNLLKYLLLLIAVVVLVFPMYWILVTAVSPRGRLLAYPPNFLAVLHPRLENFARVFRETSLVRWFLNSVKITGLTIGVSIPTAIMAGYSLSRSFSRGISMVGSFLLIARMLPAALLMIPLYIIFQRVGLLNKHISVVIANVSFIVPFTTWMLKGYFDSIPISLEEAALVDGATLTQALFKVVLPLAKPGLAATTVYAAILSWSDFVFANTLLSRVDNWTLPVGIASFQQQNLVVWNDMMAVSFLSIVPIMVLFTILQKHLISGLTAGAIKQ